MDPGFLLKGFIIGFSIAAPVGPIGVLCIRRTLTYGIGFGFLSGLGAATADAIYGIIAGFGLTVLSDSLIGQQLWLRLVGGLFLGYLGVKTFLTNPAEKPAVVEDKGLLSSYLSTFLLTLTNPMTIISFTAVFAGLGLGANNSNYLSSLFLVIGVFLGSSSWWLLLSFGVNLLRKKVTVNGLRWINKGAGFVIFAFGLMALVSVVL